MRRSAEPWLVTTSPERHCVSMSKINGFTLGRRSTGSPNVIRTVGHRGQRSISLFRRRNNSLKKMKIRRPVVYFRVQNVGKQNRHFLGRSDVITRPSSTCRFQTRGPLFEQLRMFPETYSLTNAKRSFERRIIRGVKRGIIIVGETYVYNAHARSGIERGNMFFIRRAKLIYDLACFFYDVAYYYYYCRRRLCSSETNRVPPCVCVCVHKTRLVAAADDYSTNDAPKLAKLFVQSIRVT